MVFCFVFVFSQGPFITTLQISSKTEVKTRGSNDLLRKLPTLRIVSLKLGPFFRSDGFPGAETAVQKTWNSWPRLQKDHLSFYNFVLNIPAWHGQCSEQPAAVVQVSRVSFRVNMKPDFSEPVRHPHWIPGFFFHVAARLPAFLLIHWDRLKGCRAVTGGDRT